MPWAQFRGGRVTLVEPLIVDDDPMIDGTARTEP
jgi:hypothetical protein